MRWKIKVHIYLVGKPLARPRYRWEYNIKFVLKEIK
jgi:hypothetical protein